MTSVSPFKIIVSEDNYLINGGKIINYFNPLNYRRVRKDADGETIPFIENNLTNDHIYPLGIFVKVEIFLMASFKPPQFWVPGHNFSPIIDSAWIVRKETDSGNNITVSGSVSNSNAFQMRFESDTSTSFGAAHTVTPIGIINKVGNEYVIKQALNSNFVFTRLFDSETYFIYNNILDVPEEELASSIIKTSNDINRFVYRGNVETIETPTAGLQVFFDPPINAGFLESHPGF